ATVARGEDVDFASMLEVEVEAGIAAGLGAAPTIGHEVGMVGRIVLCCKQVGKAIRRGLYQQDIAGRADGAGHLHVQRNLLSPSDVGSWIVRPASLIHLPEALIGRGRSRSRDTTAVRDGSQPKGAAIDIEVGFGIRVIEGVYNGDRGMTRAARDGIRCLE